MKQVVRKRIAEANNVSNKKDIYTVVFDMNNIMKIALVNSDELNSDGKSYGMVHTAIHIIGSVLEKKDFDYCIAAYDGFNSGILRYNIYKPYKENRGKNYSAAGNIDSDYDKYINNYVKKVFEYSRQNKRKGSEDEEESFQRQKAILKSILEELCVRQYEFDNVEGDDIISYYVHSKKENEKIVIVSTDKDLTQLVCDSVIVYNPRKKSFVTNDNCVNELGIRVDNVVVEKILCGDASDNIKGIKGVGESSLSKYFPELKERKVTIDDIVKRAGDMLQERKESKKKPLKILENIVGCVTDGEQGDRIYDINMMLIDLSAPLMTDEAVAELKEELYSPIDTNDRSASNVYQIARDEDMKKILEENEFSRLMSPFSRIIKMEQGRYKDYLNGSQK